MDFSCPERLSPERFDSTSRMRIAERFASASGPASFFGRAGLGWCVVVALLVFAGLHVLVRGPVDLKGHFSIVDFANHYSAARLWLIGADSYDASLLQLTWFASGPGAVETFVGKSWSLLPPGGLVVLAPLAALPAGWAIALWFAMSIVMIWACLSTVLWLAKFDCRGLHAWLLIASALAAAPFQTLLAVGQFSLITITCILLTIRCAQTNRPVLAGLLLGIGGAIKPQFALPFGIFYLAYRNWRLAGAAVATVAALNVIGIAQLEWRGHNWLAGWMWNFIHSADPGNCNDLSLANLQRNQMIHLNLLMASIVPSQRIAVALAAVISSALIGGYVWLARRGKLSADSLLSLSIVAVIGLLPVYHRSYDAAILVLPLAWALSALRGPLKTAAWLTIAALSPFLIPFDLLPLLERKLGLFNQMSQSWLWTALIAPHHAWASVCVGACLIGALHRRVRQLSTTVAPTDEEVAVALTLSAGDRAINALTRWQNASRNQRIRRSA